MPSILARYLQEEQSPPPACIEHIWTELVGQGVPAVDTQLQMAALVILWMAMRLEEFPNICSKTFAEAAGVDGQACWGLVLSSSARVTQMTYQTVIGVRYPELVEVTGTGCTFGRFVPMDEQLRGGFLPVF